MEKSRGRDPVSRKSPLLLLLLVSLALNAYFWSRLSKPSSEVLASVGNEKLTLDGLDPYSRELLKRKAEMWVQDRILSKEAPLRSMTVPQLLQKEVMLKVSVDSAVVYQRYVHSPAADKIGWPKVMKPISDEIKGQSAARLRDDFLRALYPKYQAHFRKDETMTQNGKSAYGGTNFPPYIAPPAETRLTADGLVTAPPFKGPAQAPVVLEIYSDFLCPFSHRFFGTAQQISAQYPDQVRVVFRHFPLPMHEGSHLMSEASICAQEQGKFWEYHDKMMSGDPLKRDKGALKQLAQELGLDAQKFQTCLDSGKYVSQVDRDIARGGKAGVQGTPSYLINGRLSVGANPLEAIKPLIDWYLKPEGAYPGQKPPTPSQQGPGQQAPAQDPNLIHTFDPQWLNSGPSQGPEKAPITVVEFFDYNCPFCQKGSATVDELVKRHEGKMRVIPKNFPLPMHPNALKTAEALMCADKQGKYWQYRQEVFGEYWSKNAPDDLKAIAKKTGLKEKDFDACMDSDATKDLIAKDQQVGVVQGVQGTPGFFVNGKFINGAMPIESFEAIVQAALSAPAKKDGKDAPPSKDKPQVYV